jgi:hypothetical protein
LAEFWAAFHRAEASGAAGERAIALDRPSKGKLRATGTSRQENEHG